MRPYSPPRSPLPSNTPAPSSPGSRQLNVKDALSYLEMVKVKFQDKPDVYNHFLDIMKDWKSQAIDPPGVIDRVSSLFNGHTALIQGFNTFLPQGYRIDCTVDQHDHNLITVTTPSGTTTRTTGGPPRHVSSAHAWPGAYPAPAYPYPRISGGQLPPLPRFYYDNSPATAHAVAALQGGPPLIQGATPAAGPSSTPGPPVHPDAIPNTMGAPMVEFNQAVNYVNRIKQRFASDPDTYKQFLEILQTYQKEQRPIAEVYQQVNVLFNNQRDLLEDFQHFLPDNGAAGGTGGGLLFGMMAQIKEASGSGAPSNKAGPSTDEDKRKGNSRGVQGRTRKGPNRSAGAKKEAVNRAKKSIAETARSNQASPISTSTTQSSPTLPDRNDGRKRHGDTKAREPDRELQKRARLDNVPTPPPLRSDEDIVPTSAHKLQPKDVVMSAQMSSEEMFELLVNHGCANLSSHMDPDQYSSGLIIGGGFGDIWEGKLRDGTKVAIKVWRFRSLPQNGPKTLKRAMREIYYWSKAKHQNIHELMGVIMFQGRLGMVSLWMDHGNLREYIGKYPDVDRYSLCVQVATGVLYLHGCKMVHGDLKAANILVSHDGVIKLSDFDHSIMTECSLAFSETSKSGGGTTRWMAPELLLEEDNSCRNEHTDIYALGMTMLEIVTGTSPYYPECKEDHHVIKAAMQGRLPKRQATYFGNNARENQMWELLLHCWSREPTARPKATDVLESLGVLIGLA